VAADLAVRRRFEMEDTKQTVIDLDAFVPRTRRSIKIDGTAHPVVELLDLAYEDYLRVVALPERLDGADDKQQFELLAEVITRMVPSLSREALTRMSLRKAGVLFTTLTAAVKGEAASEDPLGSQPTA
jgi:hypothetical protein